MQVHKATLALKSVLDIALYGLRMPMGHLIAVLKNQQKLLLINRDLVFTEHKTD
jgi:hypothetical protein